MFFGRMLRLAARASFQGRRALNALARHHIPAARVFVSNASDLSLIRYNFFRPEFEDSIKKKVVAFEFDDLVKKCHAKLAGRIPVPYFEI